MNYIDSDLKGSNKDKVSKYLLKILSIREVPLFLIILIGVIIIGSTSSFFNPGNIKALFLNLSLDAIMVIGMTILLASGGFDLSIGSVFALGGIVSALLSSKGVNTGLVIIIGILCGVLVGLLNGLIIAKIGVNALITTLGMLGIARGAVLVITQGYGVADLQSSFKLVGQTLFFGIQTPIWIMLLFLICFHFLLTKTKFFRQYYYIGGNEKAATLVGINVVRLKIISYVLSGGFAALAGIIFVSRIGASTVTMGENTELRVISAAIIGGCSMAGGEGTIIGSFLGVLLMALITNAFNLFGFSIYWQRIVTGLILIGAVVIDIIIKKRRGV